LLEAQIGLLAYLLAEIGLTGHLLLDDAAMLVGVLDDDELIVSSGEGRARETEKESVSKGVLYDGLLLRDREPDAPQTLLLFQNRL
jgi:hypothetical protein